MIILRGRDRDVGKLADVIQQLERFSQEAEPQVRIVPLQHASSEAIQTIVDQIKEDLTGTRQGRVSVTPLIKPNAVLVVGWGESMDSVVSLIAKLDTPVAPESQFAVFRLAHARATAVQQTIQQFFLNRQGLGPSVVAVADVRSNSVIVYAAPRDMAEVSRLVESVDVQESNVVQQARILPLEHSLASDLASTLQAAIAAARGDASAPSTVLELLTIDPTGRQLLKTGVLASVQVTANPRNNTLIVSGPANSMDLIEALVRQLDSPVDSAQIKVFRIINGDATSLIRMLQALLPSQIGQAGTSQLSSAEDEPSLAPLRFSVDTRTNSIIATGSEGDLQDHRGAFVAT